MLIYFAILAYCKFRRSRVALFRRLFTVLIIFNLVMTLNWMGINRPFFNLYFNQLAGRNIEENWETDYWNLSGRDALTWIVNSDSRKELKIQTSDNSPLYDSGIFLSDYDKNRISFLWFSDGVEKADYLIVHPSPPHEKNPDEFLLATNAFHLVHEKFVGSALIYEIYKRKITKTTL